jgi:hypothetical protein
MSAGARGTVQAPIATMRADVADPLIRKIEI